MATGFATFANGGVRCSPIALASVTDAAGTKYDVPGADCQRAMSPEVAAGVTHALQYMLTNGSGYAIPSTTRTPPSPRPEPPTAISRPGPLAPTLA
ncbi:hypothetical protein NHF46_09775 [Arthrobacter alpinus]|nr:hypothetical protein [Arthrobacter alpinus]